MYYSYYIPNPPSYVEKSRRVHELRQASSESDGAESLLKMARIESQRNKDSEQRLLREREEKGQKLQLLEMALREPVVRERLLDSIYE
jgi:hypothetical protein